MSEPVVLVVRAEASTDAVPAAGNGVYDGFIPGHQRLEVDVIPDMNSADVGAFTALVGKRVRLVVDEGP